MPGQVNTKTPRSARCALGCATLLALAASGCIPVVYVTPPARVTASIGASIGEDEVGVQTAVAGSLQPLHLFDPTTTRWFDVGVGWGGRFGFERPVAHGPLLELGLFQPISPNVRFAAIGRAQPISVVGSNSPWFTDGTSVALQLGVDYAFWNDGPTADCEIEVGEFCGVGYAFGEGGVGGYLELGIDQIQGRQSYAVMAGFSGRLPATWGAGVVFIDIFDALFEGDDDF